MEKSIIITGSRGAGKTTKAKEIANQFSTDEVVFIELGSKKLVPPFIFYECTEKTKLVVFEELSRIEQISNFVYYPITVNKQNKSPFNIAPKFVIVCKDHITHEQIKAWTGVERRFDIINVESNRVEIKNKFLKTIKSKRFLYAFLTSVLLYFFAIGSARLWAYLIPWPVLEIIVWFIVYFVVLGFVVWNWDDWLGKYCR
jgi:hypothetical protein